jgi:hypothetical protein
MGTDGRTDWRAQSAHFDNRAFPTRQKSKTNRTVHGNWTETEDIDG